VTKTPVPNSRLTSGATEMFNIKEHSRHILFCGTHIIQTRYYGSQKVKAVVIRTGKLLLFISFFCRQHNPLKKGGLTCTQWSMFTKNVNIEMGPLNNRLNK
jgi:hypothetical protein